MLIENRFSQQTSPPLTRPRSSSTAGNNLVLIGIMGAGKSTIGPLCAECLGYDFVDTDDLIVSTTGMSIPEIFSKFGEAHFRDLERSVIAEVSIRDNVVIATGGGAPIDPQNAKYLKATGLIYYLKARPHILAQRIGDPASRPILAVAQDPVAHLTKLHELRKGSYSRLADGSIDTGTLSPRAAAELIVNRLREYIHDREIRRSDFSTLVVPLSERSYPIHIGRELLNDVAGNLVAQCGSINRACIVTHPRLKAAYADPLCAALEAGGISSSIRCIPAGEQYKTLRTVERLYDAFVLAALDRKSVAIAVGGGVIGDMVGFAAASYLRGIRFVQVPTTLLAQVDSSVGGKTGVDLPSGKNLVGAFHQPVTVIIDLNTLGTLPQRELTSGLAEVIKYGIIIDNVFYNWLKEHMGELLARDHEHLKHAIMRSCEIKSAVVAEDETEQGLRAILNFGHTVGHAIESVTNYSVYRHGEAISIGMVSACLVGEELGITPHEITRDVRSCLISAGLPVDFPQTLNLEAIHQSMLLDKKTQSGKLRFVIAERIGNVRIVDNVSPELVFRALARQKRN